MQTTATAGYTALPPYPALIVNSYIAQMKINCLFFFLCCIFTCHAQHPVYYNYRSNNGLPSDEVYNVRTDSMGYLWFGTDRGVARFDGNHFETYSVNDGIDDNVVNDILSAPNGDLWVVADAKRLYRFTGNRFEAYPYNNILPKVSGPVSVAWIGQVHFENNYPSWFSIRSGGLLYIGRDGRYRRERNNYPENTLTYDPGKKLSSFYQLPGMGISPNKEQISYSFNNKNYTSVNSGASVCLERKNGRVLISLGNRLFELSGDGTVSDYQFSNIITNIFEDNMQRLWITLYGNGARMYPPGAFPGSNNEKIFFPSIRISGVAQDREGGYWFTSYDRGVYYVPNPDVLVIESPLLQPGEFFQELLAANGRVYAATVRSRIFQINTNNALQFVLSGPEQEPPNNCNDLVYDSISKKLYGCYSRGVYFKNLQSGRTGISTVSARSVLPVQNGFYVLSPVNIAHHKKSAGAFYNGGTFFCTYPLADSLLLIGFENGLLQYDYHVYKPVFTTTINKRVTAIRKLDNGWLVAATLGKGLILIRGEQLVQVPLGTKKSANMVNDIAVNSHTVWAATESGIVKVGLANPDEYHVQAIAADNRFPYSNIRKIAYHDAKLYALAQNNLIVFPEQYPLNKQPPPVWLQQVIVDDSIKLTPAQKHNLSIRNKRFRFIFNGICFTCGDNTRYLYRLEGLHHEWYATKQDFVEYPALAPGTYTFEVKAVNDNNVLSVNTAGYTFTIPKPFWMKTWFWVACIVVAGSLIAGLVHRRLKKIQLRNREKELLLAKEQVALSAQISPHFIFNALNSIQHLVIQEDRKQATLHMASFSKLMRLGLDNSRKKWVAVKDEIELLGLYLHLEKLRFKDKFDYHIIIDKAIDETSVRIPAMLIQPFVENAIHHGVRNLPDKKGIITVTLTMQHRHLLASIEDNGIGRVKTLSLKDIHAQHQSAGMQITRERLMLLCRETGTVPAFDITDKHDGAGRPSGTLVTFNMPYLKAASNE